MTDSNDTEYYLSDATVREVRGAPTGRMSTFDGALDTAMWVFDTARLDALCSAVARVAEAKGRDTPQEERLWPVPFDRDGDDDGMPLSREDVQRVMNDICGWFELGRKVVPPDQMLNNVGASLLLGAGLAVQRAVVEKLTRRATPDTEGE